MRFSDQTEEEWLLPYLIPFPILYMSEEEYRAMNPFVKNGTANFGRNIPAEISGPTPEVIPNILIGSNLNESFHLNSDRNFRNLWHNGRHPRRSETTDFISIIFILLGHITLS